MIPAGVLSSARVAGGGGLITDSFNRTNGAIGTTDTGQTYTTVGTWNVESNVARCMSINSNHYAAVPAWADVDVQADISIGSNQYPGLCARFADASNTYIAIYNGPLGRWEMYRIASGTQTLVGTPYSTAWATTTALFRVVEGAGQTNLTLFLGGVSRITYTDTETGRPSGIGAGLSKAWGSNLPQWNNLVITEI